MVVLYMNKSIDDFDYWLNSLYEGNPTLSNIPENIWTEMKNTLIAKLKKSSVDPIDSVKLNRMRKEYTQKAIKSNEDVNNYLYPLTREGFMLELALANARIISNNDWDSINNAKTSIWLTPSYRFNVNKDPTIIDIIDIMAVVRVTINDKKVDSINYFDFGTKLQWVHNKVSFSGELIYRFLSKKQEEFQKNYTYKAGVTFSYKINDFVTFKTTFGTTFNGNTTKYDDPQSLMIIGGINFGLSGFTPGINNKLNDQKN
jgi:hypothetical protein